MGRPAGRHHRALHAHRRCRGHHRRSRGRGGLCHLAARVAGPSGRGRPGGRHLGGVDGRWPGRRGGARHGPVAARADLHVPVTAGHHQLRLLHHRFARLPPARPARLPVRAGHQPELAGPVRGPVQLPRGHVVHGHPGPHRRRRPLVPPFPDAARGPVLAGLVRGQGRRAALRPGGRDALRPSSISCPSCGTERLLNRNLLLVDFALAVLLGWWLHTVFDRPAAPSEDAAGSPIGRGDGPGPSDGCPDGEPRSSSPAHRVP